MPIKRSALIAGLSCAAALLFAAVPAAWAQVVFDDSWADGGRTDGTDPTDINWWNSSSVSGIEVSTNTLGLVSGTSGRSIHGTFAPITLDRNQAARLTYTFTTPATVGFSRSSAVRAGLFDTLGRAGLQADLTASSGSPQPLYNGIPGYMSDFDVDTGSENTTLRERDTADTQGRFMETTSAYNTLGSGGTSYSFGADTEYVGTLEIARSPLSEPDAVTITATLSQGGNLLSSHTETDSSTFTTTFGMVGFHNISRTFGSSNSPGDPDNGVDFSNIKLEVYTVPEPTSLALLGLGGLMIATRRR